MDIPQERLVIYYIKNPYSFCCYAEIYEPLKDVVIEVA